MNETVIKKELTIIYIGKRYITIQYCPNIYGIIVYNNVYKSPRKINRSDINSLYACVYMINNDTIIEDAAKKYDMPRSTLHWKIHHFCRFACPELYVDVKDQIKKNIKNRCKRRNK